MRVLVCGGREFGSIPRWAVFGSPEYARLERKADEETALLNQTLDSLDESDGITVLIHGAARGADRRAAQWASRRGVAIEPYPADWYPNGFGKLDKSAGPKRNAKMLAEGKPDLVIAFPGGDGTADMVEKAERAGVKVRKIVFPPPTDRSPS